MTQTRQGLDNKELRKFGLLTGAIVMALFGGLLRWLLNKPLLIWDDIYYQWPWMVGGFLWVWALLLPATLKPVYRLWMAFGHVAGWINSRIILAILFYLVIFPFGLLLRLVRKDPMARKFNRRASTYRVISKVQDRHHMERPF